MAGWCLDDLAPLMDIIEALKSVKLSFAQCFTPTRYVSGRGHARIYIPDDHYLICLKIALLVHACIVWHYVEFSDNKT